MFLLTFYDVYFFLFEGLRHVKRIEENLSDRSLKAYNFSSK